MADDAITVVVEGPVKYRDGKKWKTRWCVVRKLSPVADCLNLQLFRDSKDKLKQGQTKANLSLENLLAVESGFTLDKESYTLAVLCQDVTVVLAFESKEILILWQVKIKTNLGEEQQFNVQIVQAPPKSKIMPGPAKLHIQDWLFCLVAGLPPRLIHSWQFKDLRKYGVIDGKFCFEGGSKCGKGEGYYIFTSNQAEDLSTTFDLASQGKLLSKRKLLSAKNSIKLMNVDGTLRKSSAVFSGGVDNKETCSAESTRPLLNSSDSSICDACSEVARCAGGGGGGGGDVECWMSAESRHLGSMDTLSVAISETQGEAGCPLKVWVPEAGAYLVDRVALLERCTEKTLLSPKWLEGSGDAGDGNEKSGGKIAADVMSLSSQGSNSSSSEYSVPRVYTDTYYDKPRNVLGSLVAADVPSLPPRSPLKGKMDSKSTSTKSRSVVMCQYHSEIKSDAPPNLSGLTTAHCTCAATSVWDNPAYVATPGSNSGTPLCSPKKSHTHLPANNSPTKARPSAVQLNLMSPSRRSALPTPSSVASTPSACSCSQIDSKINPYGNYAIPRSALAHVYLKEHQTGFTPPSSASTSTATTPSVDRQTCSTRTSVVSSDSSEYDVPRRLKDCLTAMELKENQSTSTNSPQGFGLGLNFPSCSCGMRGKPLPRFVGPLCPCQRVTNWAEHLVPCRRQTTVDDTSNSCPHHKATMEAKMTTNGKQEGEVKTIVHQRSCLCSEGQDGMDWVSRPPVDHSTKPQMTSSFNQRESTPCTTQPTADPTSSLKWTAIKGTPQLPNYANVEVEQVQQASKEPNKLGDLKANYANMEFVDSLPLYENTVSVLNRSTDASSLDQTIPGDDENKSQDQSPLYGVACRCSSCGHHFLRVIPEGNNTSRPQSVAENSKVSQSDNDKGNYLMMQPVSGRCTPIGTPMHQSMTLPRDRKSFRDSDSNLIEESPTSAQSSEYIRMADLGDNIKNLPLRPFLPLRMSARWKDFEPLNLDSFRTRSCSNTCENYFSLKKSCMNRSLSLESRTVRSNSVVELQKEVFLRKRSSSADSRSGSSSTSELAMRAFATFSTHRPSVLTRLNMTGEKSHSNSSEDFAKASSTSSRVFNSRNLSSENLGKQEIVDVDVVLRNLEVNNLHRSDSSPTTIKRSSNVPCNPGNRDSASSSDSGVSTGSPKQACAFPSAADSTYMEMSVVQSAGAMNVNDQSNGLVLRLKRHDSSCKNASIDSEVPVWIKREDLKDGSPSPNHELTAHACFVDSKSNSSTSDMSDYIETLSLSSHGSSDLPRADETPRLPCCITSTLRPRSGREYQTLNRSVLEECLLHQSVDCSNTAAQDTGRTDSTSTTLAITAEKSESPSPGYGSCSSPAEGQRDALSPGKKQQHHFVFPLKELNYVQVEGNEMEPKILVSSGHQSSTVQYAMIDVVATSAAKKAANEQRKQGSPRMPHVQSSPSSHH